MLRLCHKNINLKYISKIKFKHDWWLEQRNLTSTSSCYIREWQTVTYSSPSALSKCTWPDLVLNMALVFVEWVSMLKWSVLKRVWPHKASETNYCQCSYSLYRWYSLTKQILQWGFNFIPLGRFNISVVYKYNEIFNSINWRIFSSWIKIPLKIYYTVTIIATNNSVSYRLISYVASYIQ